MKRLLKFTKRFFINKGKEIWWVLSWTNNEGMHWILFPILWLIIAVVGVSIVISFLGLTMIMFEGIEKFNSFRNNGYFWDSFFWWHCVTIYSIPILVGISAFVHWIVKNIIKAWEESKDE